MTDYWTDVSVGTPGQLAEECRAVLERIAQFPPVHALSPEAARQQFALAVRKSNPRPPAGVTSTEIVVEGLRLRLYRPAEGPLPVLVFFHGGGFVIGDLETHDPICRWLAAKAGSIVVAVDYRLAPEHPYPAAVDDAWAALRWTARQFPDRRIGVCGDSAGGTLAAVAAIKARDAGIPLAMQILIYPATDVGGDHASRRQFAEGYLLGEADIRWFRQHHTAGKRLLDAAASPLRAASHAGLVPAVVLTAGFDPLRDEGLAYVRALRAAGVPTRHVCFEDTVHGCLGLAGFLAAGRAMLDEAAAAWAGA